MIYLIFPSVHYLNYGSDFSISFVKQVLIDGIGIFNLCLGQEFSSCGFLHSCLYVLLENLICSNFQIRSAVDGVLHVISATSGYPTVCLRVHYYIFNLYDLWSMTRI